MPPKALFRFMNRVHIFLYRSSGGRILGKIAGSPVLLLTTTGRKTGQPRTVPLVHLKDNQRYAVIASHHPAWYNNLKSNPNASIEVKGQTYTIRAQEATSQEDSDLWTRFVAQSPMFDAYKNHPDHQMVVLEIVG